MQLCSHNRHSQRLKNNLQYHYEDLFIKFMHMTASVWETRALCKSLHNNNSLKTTISPELPTTCRYPIYKHSTFLCHKLIRALADATVGYCNGHNHTSNNFEWKGRHHFCQPRWSYYFGYNKKWFHIRNIKYRSNYEYFYQKLSPPLEKRQKNPKGSWPQVENHFAIAFTLNLQSCRWLLFTIYISSSYLDLQ